MCKIVSLSCHSFRYLHEVCSPPVLHKNIKSSNVLLDADLNPHLSDCGLSFFYEVCMQSGSSLTIDEQSIIIVRTMWSKGREISTGRK